MAPTRTEILPRETPQGANLMMAASAQFPFYRQAQEGEDPKPQADKNDFHHGRL
jgi:hypothetical protein